MYVPVFCFPAERSRQAGDEKLQDGRDTAARPLLIRPFEATFAGRKLFYSAAASAAMAASLLAIAAAVIGARKLSKLREASASSVTARDRHSQMLPAFFAPFSATVATGKPLGITAPQWPAEGVETVHGGAALHQDTSEDAGKWCWRQRHRLVREAMPAARE